jgi:ParB family chromosome partitioning protein
MGKLDDLRRTAGATARDSASPTMGVPPQGSASAGAPNRYQGVVRDKEANVIPLDRIIPDPDQPRTEFDPESLERLAESLKARGQIQPISVRWDEGRGAYVILTGERRWRAAALAGMPTIRAVVNDRDLTPDEKLEIQLVENALREDLKPVEQARAYRVLMDSRGWSLRQLAAELHLAHSSVSRALSLLDLPEEVRSAVDQGQLGPTLALEVGRLEDPAMQAEVARAAVSEKLTRSEVSDLVQAVKARRPAPAEKPEPLVLEVAPGVVVSVRWRKASDLSAMQALRKATRLLQERSADVA